MQLTMAGSHGEQWEYKAIPKPVSLST